MFKHILVPTDGSKLSERAIKNSVRMAKTNNARITALTVIPKFHTFGVALESTRDEYEAQVSAHAQCFVDFAHKVAAAAGVDCDSVKVVSDQPYKEIVKAAQKKGCDLILMASHGRRGIEGFLIGSETQKVLTHSTVPVLVYR